MPEDIVAAVRDEATRDDIQTAELINRGTPAAPTKMGVDGGMNPTFLSAVKNNGGPGGTIRTAAGTIPAHVNPPAEPKGETTGSTPFPNPFAGTLSLASTESKPAAAPRSATPAVQVASASPTSGGIGNFFSNLFGSKSEEPAAAPSKPEASAPKSKPAAAPPKPAPTAVAAKQKSEPQKSEPQLASAGTKPVPMRQEASAVPSKPENINDLLTGAAPTVPTAGFENRFGAWR